VGRWRVRWGGLSLGWGGEGILTQLAITDAYIYIFVCIYI